VPANLGLDAAERERHIGWDIGICAVSRLVGEALDATVITQNYSRLAIDCNRMPGSATSIVEISELTTVPGNIALGEAQKNAASQRYSSPITRRSRGELAQRRQAGRASALVAMHSFTPVFKSVARPWHVGVLYNRDPRFAHVLLKRLRGQHGLVVGDNEPYSVTDASDYTIPVHGEQRGLHHVAIEIRQDLITDERGQRRWAELFARLLPQAYRQLVAVEAGD